MRYILAAFAACLLSTAVGAQYESSFGIKAIPSHMHPGKPLNYQYSYDFSHGPKSFAGTWKALAGGGMSDGAELRDSPEVGTDGSKALKFTFDLVPDGDLWALLHFVPGDYSRIELTPRDGFFFRARTHGAEMDGYPARWYIRIRILDAANRYVTYNTEYFQVLTAWQTYYVSAMDFGRAGKAGLFTDGASKVRLYDVSFIPIVAKYRKGDLTLDAFMVYGPGEKRSGDKDGDGVPDAVDGDHDNDGVLDFAQTGGHELDFRLAGFIQGGGRWFGKFLIHKAVVEEGDTLEVDVNLHIESEAVATAIKAIPEVVGLLSGERWYDRDGRYHAFTNHMVSGLLTPTGFPIENFQPLVPTRHARMSGVSLFTSPVDAVCKVPLTLVKKSYERTTVAFSFRVPVTSGIPDGFYRLFFEFGVTDRNGNFLRLDSLPGVAAGKGIGRSGYKVSMDENLVFEKKIVLPMVKIGKPAAPRMPWALLFDTEIHGVRGVVPEEERGQWALNARNRLGGRPIYPRGKYNLEPGFPGLAYHTLNIEYPLNCRSGEVSVQVTDPDGETVDLGTASFVALTTWGATTRTGKFLHDFKKYGEYRIRMKGWILDAYGNRYTGGGTYRIWIAERITFGTFPSLPYEVGRGFLHAAEVVPPVPAKVTLSIDFYPYSDPKQKEVFSTTGKANRLGMFVAPRRYVFKHPGEYFSRMEAEYVDPGGRLWIASLWGANVVAPKESSMIAHGNTGYILNGMYIQSRPRYSLGVAGSVRGYKNFFLNYPFLNGDVLYVPSTMDHMNSIYPGLTMEFRNGFVPYGGELGKQPVYPLQPTTTTGHSPFCFPEQINRMAYMYADGWRPGVSGRHVIATAQMMNSYWSVSPSLLGRQMHTSPNGDLPGDFYRFTGGLVYRDLETGKAHYAIYASMGVVTSTGDMNNRVVAPCTEPLLRMNGRDHYLFLGGGIVPVPGMTMIQGGRIPSGGSANPPVPADLETTLVSPSGRKFNYKQKASWIGVFSRGHETLTIVDEPGVWFVRQKLSYQGKTGDVLGSEDGEYCFYVLPADKEKAFDLVLDLPPISRVKPKDIVRLSGVLPEDVVDGTLHYTTISPGLIIEEGTSPVVSGTFCYEFDPWETGKRISFFDTVDILTGRPILCDTVVFNLFLDGRRADGTRVFGHRVVAMRGDKVINVTPVGKPGKD